MKKSIHYLLILLLTMSNFPLHAMGVNVNVPNLNINMPSEEEIKAAGKAHGEGLAEALAALIAKYFEPAPGQKSTDWREWIKENSALIGEELNKQVGTLGENLVKGGIEGAVSEAKGATKTITSDILTGGLEALEEASQGQQLASSTKNIVTGVLGQGTTGTTAALRDPELHRKIKETGKAFGEVAGVQFESVTGNLADAFHNKGRPNLERFTQDAAGSVFNIRNAAQVGGPIALAIAIPIGTVIALSVLQQHLLNPPKPQILLPGANYGRRDRLSRWWSGYKTPAMVFDQQVKDRLIEIEEKTKNIKNHIRNGKKITYDNLLLYGEPGTGKTLFAQILADNTDMDFLPVTAGSLLQSGVEGIKYIDQLIHMANVSKNGVIIFVDEADALFINRDTLSPESDHYKVLNHILALTGSGSSKFMLVAATNHAYLMDQAMGRRFQDRVLMPLPGKATRKELIDLYLNQTLFNEKENSQEFVGTAYRLLTGKVIADIVDKTEGLSHAEIKDMIVAIGKKASATKDGMITFAHIQRALKEAIEKKQALEADKLKLEQRMEQQKRAQSPA